MTNKFINAKMQVVFDLAYPSMCIGINNVISVKTLEGIEFFNTFEKLFEEYCKKLGLNFDYNYAKKYNYLASVGISKEKLIIKFDHESEIGEKIIDLVDHFKDHFIFYVKVNTLNWGCEPYIYLKNDVHTLSYKIDYDLILLRWVNEGCPENWIIS